MNTAGQGRVARTLMRGIGGYQRWISSATPARCRFHPSCSTYAVEALEKHGALRGLGLSIWRIVRCQPFHPGGYDPVPESQPRVDLHRNSTVLPGAGCT